MTDYFKDSSVAVGGRAVPFKLRPVRGGLMMYLPESFLEDDAVVANYSYFYSKDKSPLGIAVKYSGKSAVADKARMLESYFSAPPEKAGEGVFYRETVTNSQYMSVYSLRFAVDAGGGLLLGCFNCQASYRDDWKPVVLEILNNLDPGV
jgi:hypothetical protein